MKKRWIAFLLWVLWVSEGKAWNYYRKQWEVLWAFTIPNLFRKSRYTAPLLINSISFDKGEQILQQAIKQNNEERFIWGQKKAQLGVERFMRVKGAFTPTPDIEGEHSGYAVKLTREERAHSDALYRRLSFGR